MSTILKVEDATKQFGGLTAVDSVSISIEDSEITGLIGPNGAGKSTLFDLVTGFHDLTEGRIRFNGEDISNSAPEQRAQRGLIRTFQITRELSGMTVLENMLLASRNPPDEKVLQALFNNESVREHDEQARERATEILEMLDIYKLRDEYAGNLSGGQRKLLELGRTLMADPELLLLDEPMAGVNPDLSDKLFEHIISLCEQEGLAFLIIEHDMDSIMEISDKVIGMHQGQVMTVGDPQTVQQDEAFLEAYMGGS
jgi:branched-chain amino acid transport system ATP-binding protein